LTGSERRRIGCTTESRSKQACFRTLCGVHFDLAAVEYQSPSVRGGNIKRAVAKRVVYLRNRNRKREEDLAAVQEQSGHQRVRHHLLLARLGARLLADQGEQQDEVHECGEGEDCERLHRVAASWVLSYRFDVSKTVSFVRLVESACVRVWRIRRRSIYFLID
jgi:hypothetical protein